MLLEFIKGQNNQLIPSDNETFERMQKIKIGDTVFVEYKPRRNYQFHKKLFSLLNFVYANQDHYKSVNNILEAVKFRAGYFEAILFHTGEPHYKATSIAFHAMDDIEFEEFYSKAIDVCLELIPMGKQELENAVLTYL